MTDPILESAKSPIPVADILPRLPVWILLGALCATALLYLGLFPRHFQSHMVLLVRVPQIATADPNSPASPESVIQSELALLRSPQLAPRIVNSQSATASQPAPAQQLQDATIFERNLATQAVPNSNRIHVTFTSGNPHQAAEVLTRLLDAFFLAQPEASPSAATTLFAAEADANRIQATETRGALEVYRGLHPAQLSPAAASLDHQIRAIQQHPDLLDRSIEGMLDQILNSERRLSMVPGESEAQPGSRLSIAQLTILLNIRSEQRAILSTRLPPGTPALADLNHRIAGSLEALQIARQSPPSKGEPLAQQANETVTEAINVLRKLYGIRDSRTSQLAELQGSLAAIHPPDPTLAALQVKADSAWQTFQFADQRLGEARIADAIDRQIRLKVAVLQPPSPSVPRPPARWISLATGLCALLFLAGCLALHLLEVDPKDAPAERTSVSPTQVPTQAIEKNPEFTGSPEAHFPPISSLASPAQSIQAEHSVAAPPKPFSEIAPPTSDSSPAPEDPESPDTDLAIAPPLRSYPSVPSFFAAPPPEPAHDPDTFGYAANPFNAPPLFSFTPDPAVPLVPMTTSAQAPAKLQKPIGQIWLDQRPPAAAPSADVADFIEDPALNRERPARPGLTYPRA